MTVATVDPIKELETLFPDNEVRGYKIKKYNIGELKKAIAIMSRNAGLFSEDFATYLLQAGESALDDIFELVTFSSDVPKDAIEEMSQEEFLEILVKIFEVNITFFSQSVVKAVNNMKTMSADGVK
jgi:hypothetical protein